MSDVADKWGEAVAQRGFAQVPNYLLLLNTFLDAEKRLSPVELLILIELSGGWWRKGDNPYPSVSTLAQRCGTSSRQVQRALKRLEEDKFIQRITRRTKGVIASNAYDLTPLVAILTEVARIYPNAFPRKGYTGGTQLEDVFDEVVMDDKL